MAFTLIDSDTSWQSLAIAQEIATSYNFRRSLCGLSTIAAPDENTEVFDFVLAVQTGIEEMANDIWLNNSASLSAYVGQSALPTAMSLPQAMTLAGLTESGYWRRIADGGTQPADWTDYGATGWSYGKMVDKDLAGPWLFKDIQLALSALTRASVPVTAARYKRYEHTTSAPPIPAESLTWSDWYATNGGVTNLQVRKDKDSGTITMAWCDLIVEELRVQISDALASKETARMLLTIPTDMYDIELAADQYASHTGKVAFSGLVSAADVTAVFGETVEHTTSKSSSGGVTSYTAIMGEDASSSQPLANSILPDANVPDDTLIDIGIQFAASSIIVDFVFE
jgi:hypothetical protein